MYEYISKTANVHCVKEMCETLGVNESGYYKKKRNIGKQSRREILSVEIIKIIEEDEYNSNYGIERVLKALKLKGINVGKRTVYRAMSELGLLQKRRKPRGIDEYINLDELIPYEFILIILGAIFMRGNPFFTQERLGKDEKIPTLYNLQ